MKNTNDVEVNTNFSGLTRLVSPGIYIYISNVLLRLLDIIHKLYTEIIK